MLISLKRNFLKVWNVFTSTTDACAKMYVPKNNKAKTLGCLAVYFHLMGTLLTLCLWGLLQSNVNNFDNIFTMLCHSTNSPQACCVIKISSPRDTWRQMRWRQRYLELQRYIFHYKNCTALGHFQKSFSVWSLSWAFLGKLSLCKIICSGAYESLFFRRSLIISVLICVEKVSQ